MSTFSGYMPEIPYISVDRFEEINKGSKMFFLSHCHTDHMKGLDNITLRDTLFTDNVYLYATDISIRILKNKYNMTENLKELPLGKPYSIKIPSQFGAEERYLCVTTISAGHCAGSVMFLFETEGKNVLYTGDLRINPKDLHKYAALHDGAGKLKKLDTLYLDTTFCNSMYEHFPSRDESVNEICKLVEEWITVSDTHIIKLQFPSYYGSEYLLKEIFKRTNHHIHVLKEQYHLFKYIPDMVKIMNTKTKKFKVHSSLGYNISCCNSFYSSAYFLRTIKPSALIWDNLKPSDKIVDKVSEYFYRVCYSNHAPLSEIRELVRYLKPLRIEPCVVPEDFDERDKLLTLLDEMRNEYDTKENVREIDGTEQFPLINVAGDVESTELTREFDLLSSPPKRFGSKRRISDI